MTAAPLSCWEPDIWSSVRTTIDRIAAIIGDWKCFMLPLIRAVSHVRKVR
jgi:hypothetical protein